MRRRVTRDEWRVEARYVLAAHGWDEVYASDTRADAVERLREYRANEPGVAFRLRCVRVRIAPAPPARSASTEERWIYSEL